MKNLMYGGLFLVFLGVGFAACNKEEIEKVNSKKNIKHLNIKYDNDKLIFKDRESFNKYLHNVSEMTDYERIKMEESLGFESLYTLDQKINKAEVEHAETFYKGIDPDLSVSEYESMGLFYEPTSIYTKYLNQGVIERIIEEDGSISTELSIKYHAYYYVLPASGMLQISNLLYSFERGYMKIENVYSNELIFEKNLFAKANGEYNFTKGINNTSGWVTDPSKGSKYRYRSFVNFSSNYTTQLVSQDFYWYARAERRRFGQWKTRNNYLPIWGFNASWNFDYWVIYNGNPYGTQITGNSSNNILANSSNRPTSPYNLSNLNTNYTVRYLYPHGTYVKANNANYDFFENVRVYSDSYSSSFSGGSSGYNYSMN